MIDAVVAAMGGRIVMYGCIGTCEQPFDWLKVHRKRLSILATEPKRDINMTLVTEGVSMVNRARQCCRNDPLHPRANRQSL